MRNLLIYGGTFDPIHNGHLNTAINVQNYFNFDRVVFLPCKIPVLKNHAIATPAQRIEMIKLALTDQDANKNFALDVSEINRNGPSYMVDTLQEFRHKLGQNLAITLLIGADIFNQLPQWYSWMQLLTLANILVINRAGSVDVQMPDLVKELLTTHETNDKKVICEQANGFIYRFDAGNFAFSSSWIRKELAAGRNVENYLAKSTLQYIKLNHLYT